MSSDGRRVRFACIKSGSGLKCVSRSLEFIAALVLEVTVLYVDGKFNDILSAEARFVVFVFCTSYAIWRAAEAFDSLVQVATAWSSKMQANLGLTRYPKAVFSQFCVKKDG
jgi:hypothetical protein